MGCAVWGRGDSQEDTHIRGLWGGPELAAGGGSHLTRGAAGAARSGQLAHQLASPQDRTPGALGVQSQEPAAAGPVRSEGASLLPAPLQAQPTLSLPTKVGVQKQLPPDYRAQGAGLTWLRVHGSGADRPWGARSRLSPPDGSVSPRKLTSRRLACQQLCSQRPVCGEDVTPRIPRHADGLAGGIPGEPGRAA